MTVIKDKAILNVSLEARDIECLLGFFRATAWS